MVILLKEMKLMQGRNSEILQFSGSVVVCSMKASIKNLMQEFTAVIFEEEMEFRDLSQMQSILPLLASQDSNADVEIIF